MADYYNSQFSGKEVDDAIEKIRSINKTNTISAESTNDQYPSAKAVYDYVYSMIVGALTTEV